MRARVEKRSVLGWNKSDTPSNPRWYFSTSVTFKTLITQRQHRLSLRHMSKKIIWDPVKKETVHQFHVVNMIHPMHKKHRTHRDQVIKIFESVFKPVTLKSIKNELTKINTSVVSLIIVYDNIKIMMYKVIGEVICTIIYNYSCLDCLGLLQENLSKQYNKFENTKFNDIILWIF